MEINSEHLRNLEACLRGNSVERAGKTDNPNQCYHVGAVWYGNWRHDASKGTFGTAEKPRHNACISWRSKKMTWFRLAPVSKEKPGNKGVVPLLAGTIPGGEYCQSYLLAKYILFASNHTLVNYFEYKCNLSQDIVRRMKEAMKA